MIACLTTPPCARTGRRRSAAAGAASWAAAGAPCQSAQREQQQPTAGRHRRQAQQHKQMEAGAHQQYCMRCQPLLVAAGWESCLNAGSPNAHETHKSSLHTVPAVFTVTCVLVTVTCIFLCVNSAFLDTHGPWVGGWRLLLHPAKQAAQSMPMLLGKLHCAILCMPSASPLQR